MLKSIATAVVFAVVCSALSCLGVWLKVCERCALGECFRDFPLKAFLHAASLHRLFNRRKEA